jgi:hypothetical protein
MKQPKWQFASTGGGTEDGVSNPEIEYFEGDYNYFLAREVLQNALDAKLEESKPVKVKFELQQFKQTMFPGYDDFLTIWNKSKEHWPEDNDKCQKFIDQGISCLKSEMIDVLKISDHNTKGLNGYDNDRKGSWFGLVKSVGSSNKQDGQGGSFGIGKGAPFAASFLRTCFYSTKNELGQNVFQGVSKIVSHGEDDGDVKRGYGSFGMINQGSVRNREQIDEHMVRKERGLDIYVMGYKVEDDWQRKLLESVLRNFWPAILHDELEVEIDGETLNCKNLEEKLTHYFLSKPTKDNNKPEGNPLEYFKAFKNSDKVFEEETDTLGNIKFYFRKSEEHLNKVAMIRKSKMVIYTRSFHFPANYSGVFICDNDKGNQELRKMESPEHDRWDKFRYKEKGGEIEYELSTFIRGSLKSLTRIEESEVLEVPGLHKYLPFDEGDVTPGKNGSGGEYTGNESEKESSKEIGKSEEFDKDVLVSPYNVAVINMPIEGVGGVGVILGKTKNKRTKKNKKGGGGNGDNDALLRSILKSRIFIQSQKNEELLYKVIVNSSIKGNCNLKLFAIGDEGSGKVKILGATDDKGNKYAASGHRIMKIPLSNGDKLVLNVKVMGTIKMALKLEGYGLQQ